MPMQTMFFFLCPRFSCSLAIDERQPHPGRSAAAITDEILLESGILCFVIVRIIGKYLNLNYTNIYQILTTELGTRKICA